MPPIPNRSDRNGSTNNKKGVSDSSPALLVSYVFLDAFLKNRNEDHYRDWVMDSGAFSALGKGETIDLHRFTDESGMLLQSDKKLKSVFALDVIGDPEASQRNAEYMHSQGVPAIPCETLGSPWHYLEGLSRSYDRIALGGMVARGEKGIGAKTSWSDRLRFLEGAFGRVWPKWIHGFGITDRRLLFAVPFAAVDSTSWFYRIRQFGGILGYPGLRAPMIKESRSGSCAAVRCSLKSHLHLEQEVRSKFGKFLKGVSGSPFVLRFATMASAEELGFVGEAAGAINV